MSVTGEAGRFARVSMYPRDRRPPGIRNRVLVIPSVICSHFVADEIADQVPGAVATSHDHGCAQLGTDKAATHRTLVNVGLNPNVAGAVVVGLGCESVQSSDVEADIDAGGLPVESVVIQDAGGTEPCIDRGVERARQLARPSAATDRSSGAVSDLTVGIVASDLRESTREIAEPLVRSLIDRVADGGGRVVVAGRERFVPAADELADRCVTAAARDGTQEMGDRVRSMPPSRSGGARQVATLDTDELLTVLGDHPVHDVVGYGEPITHNHGVGLVDAPMRFEEAATALTAAGAQVIIHLTAEGIPTGHPVAPVLKVTGNAETAAALPDDIDIDARQAGEAALLERFAAVVSGEKTCAEIHGIHEFGIARFGPKM